MKIKRKITYYYILSKKVKIELTIREQTDLYDIRSVPCRTKSDFPLKIATHASVK